MSAVYLVKWICAKESSWYVSHLPAAYHHLPTYCFMTGILIMHHMLFLSSLLSIHNSSTIFLIEPLRCHLLVCSHSRWRQFPWISSSGFTNVQFTSHDNREQLVSERDSNINWQFRGGTACHQLYKPTQLGKSQNCDCIAGHIALSEYWIGPLMGMVLGALVLVPIASMVSTILTGHCQCSPHARYGSGGRPKFIRRGHAPHALTGQGTMLGKILMANGYTWPTLHSKSYLPSTYLTCYNICDVIVFAVAFLYLYSLKSNTKGK